MSYALNIQFCQFLEALLKDVKKMLHKSKFIGSCHDKKG